MQKIFTPDFIIGNRGCYDRSKVQSLSFFSKEEISITDILDSEISLKDKCWFLRNKCNLTVLQKQWMCIGLAEIVLEIHETKYPENKAPRNAIKAAKDYLNGVVDLDELIKNKNADAAAADADAAADAADAAAYAAAAYAAAADAAGYAADAAAYAAAAAAYADADGKGKFEIAIIEFLKNFCQEN